MERNRLQSASQKFGDLRQMSPEELSRAISIFEKLNGAVLRDNQKLPTDVYKKKLPAPEGNAASPSHLGTVQENFLSDPRRKLLTREI